MSPALRGHEQKIMIDRFLPARDKGPVRRFIRDYVDSRFSFIELLMSIIITMIGG